MGITSRNIEEILTVCIRKSFPDIGHFEIFTLNTPENPLLGTFIHIEKAHLQPLQYDISRNLLKLGFYDPCIKEVIESVLHDIRDKWE